LETEIRESVAEYIPNITVTNISIKPASEGEENKGTFINSDGQREFTVPNIGVAEHTAKIRIDYIINDSAFSPSEFVIINI